MSIGKLTENKGRGLTQHTSEAKLCVPNSLVVIFHVERICPRAKRDIPWDIDSLVCKFFITRQLSNSYLMLLFILLVFLLFRVNFLIIIL